MASSQRNAACAQPPEEVTAFFKLVEKVVAASVLGRHARHAELCERAAKHAERLYGDNSLVVADLRWTTAGSLRSLACTSTSSSEHVALLRRAWVDSRSCARSPPAPARHEHAPAWHE